MFTKSSICFALPGSRNVRRSQNGFCPQEFTDERKEKLNKICDFEMKVLGTLYSGPLPCWGIKKGFHWKGQPSPDVNNKDKGEKRVYQTGSSRCRGPETGGNTGHLRDWNEGQSDWRAERGNRGKRAHGPDHRGFTSCENSALHPNQSQKSRNEEPCSGVSCKAVILDVCGEQTKQVQGGQLRNFSKEPGDSLN